MLSAIDQTHPYPLIFVTYLPILPQSYYSYGFVQYDDQHDDDY